MELFLSIAYVALFVFLIGKMKFFNVNQISKSNLKAGYLVKVLAGVSVGLIYTYYYTDRQTADTFKFFDDSKILFDSIYSSPFDFIRMLTGIGAGATDLQPYYDKMTNWYDTFSPYNDNRTMIRLNALLRFFSLGHYYVHVVFVCFLSLTGIVAIVKVFAREFPEKVLEIFLVFLLLPSVLFWGSGLLKDSLVFFALGMVMYFFDRYLYESANRNILLFLTFVSLFLLMISKFHVFVLLIPLIVAWWVAVRYKLKPFLSFFASSFIFLGILILLSYLKPTMNLAAILAQKQAAFFNLADQTAAGSAISIPLLQPNFVSVLVNAPHGFLVCLTRPFITDHGSFLITLSALENVAVLLLGIFAFFTMKPKSLQQKALPWFGIFYTITLFVLIGLVTPVMGAIVRYKAQALPFLVTFFILLSGVSFKVQLTKLFSKAKA